MSEELKIIIEYLKKELEIRREKGELNLDASKTCIFDRVLSFIDYRDIRTEQYWFSKLTAGNNERQVLEKRNELDRQRREKHNTALIVLIGMQKFGKRLNLNSLYEGNMLTEDEVLEHDETKLDERELMTNFFLKIVTEIENSRTEKTIEQETDGKFLNELKKQVETSNRNFGVKDGLNKDNGDILFYDDPKSEDYTY